MACLLTSARTHTHTDGLALDQQGAGGGPRADLGSAKRSSAAGALHGSGQGGGRGADLFKDAICWNAGSLDELIVAQPATICLCPDARARMYGAEAANPPGGDAAPAASICPCPPLPPAPACLDQGAPEWSEKSMPAASPAGLVGASTTVSRFALKVALPALSITCPASSPKMWDSTPPVTPSSTVASTLPTRANVQRSCLSPQAFNGLKAQEVASDTCQGAGVTSASGAGACETAKSPGKRLSWGPDGSRGNGADSAKHGLSVSVKIHVVSSQAHKVVASAVLGAARL